MQQTAMDLVTLLGGGAAIVLAAVGAAYWCFKLFSEKWLTAKFNERLEDYKHKQQRELEELRFKINSLMDRTTKLHQREFDVLPEAWGKLVIAHGNLHGLVAAFQQYPDRNRMNSSELTEFIDKSGLRDWQKQELLRTTDKTEYYQKASRWIRLGEVRDLYRDYFIYQRKNGIFMRNEIKSGLKTVSDLIHKALIEYDFELQNGSGFRQWDARTKFSEEGDKVIEALEVMVQERLWDSQTTRLDQTQSPPSS
jgi:hypothetical protein